MVYPFNKVQSDSVCVKLNSESVVEDEAQAQTFGLRWH